MAEGPNSGASGNAGAVVLTVWSAVKALMSITFGSPADVLGPTVAVPQNFLPAGATIMRVELMMKFRKAVDTSGSDNAIDGNQDVQVGKAVAGTPTTGFQLKNDTIKVIGGSESGGDLIVGNLDVKAEVNADNTNYSTKIALGTALGNTLDLEDVQFGLRFYVNQ